MPNYRANPPKKSEKRCKLIKEAQCYRDNGLSYVEIALKLKKPIGSISNLLSQARTKYQKETFYLPLTRSKRTAINFLIAENPQLSIQELTSITKVSPFNICRVKKNT
jgi:hypothetical protein